MMSKRSWFRSACVCGLNLTMATLARAEPPSVAVYAADPAFENIVISPSGQRLALISNTNGRRRLLIVDAQQKPLLTTDIGKGDVARLAFAGEDQLVLIHSNVTELGVGFNVQRAVLRGSLIFGVDGSPPWEVFSKDADVAGGASGYFGFAKRGDQTFGYFAGATLSHDPGGGVFQDSRPELFEVNLRDHSKRRVAAKPDGSTARTWIMAPGGGIAAMLDRNLRTGEWRLSNGEGKRIATGQNGLGMVSLNALGPNGDTAIIGETRENGKRQLFEAPLVGGALQPYKTEGLVDRIMIDTGHRLLGYVQDDDASTMHFITARNQAIGRALVKAFPNERVHWVSASDDLNRVVVRTEGSQDVSTWWLVDMKTGKADDLGTAYAVPAEEIAPTTLFDYKAINGMALDGALTLPRSAGKALPAVVLVGMSDRNKPIFTMWSQLFASRGYAVFQPNPRGSAGKGDAFFAAGDGQRGRAIQTDISDGVSTLAAAGIVDPRRVCIAGMRDGGYAALAGVTLQQGLYRCAIAIGADGDPELEYHRLAAIFNQTGLATVRKAWGDPRSLAQVSPVAHAASADAPVLLMHAKDDPLVDYEQSVEMQHALQRANKPVELVTLPNGAYLLDHFEARQGAMEAALRFVENHNPVRAGR